MTPEERLAQHEQWLADHDRAIAEIKSILAETIEIQRQQSLVLLGLAQQITRLVDRDEGRR